MRCENGIRNGRTTREWKAQGMDENRKRAPIGMRLIAGIAALPVLYILSLGPLLWFLERQRGISAKWQGVFSAYFEPSNWLAEACPVPLRAALKWYIELWV
jgi:hypothetical protein